MITGYYKVPMGPHDQVPKGDGEPVVLLVPGMREESSEDSQPVISVHPIVDAAQEDNHEAQ
jgi:hypothetical protein